MRVCSFFKAKDKALGSSLQGKKGSIVADKAEKTAATADAPRTSEAPDAQTAGKAAPAGQAAPTGQAAPAGQTAPAGRTAPAALPITNTNRWDTRQLVVLSLMCAIGVLLSFIEFPLLPGIAWLKYDASIMPAMVSGFAFGPVAGITVGVIGALIHGILVGDYVGALMNIIVVFFYVAPASLIYKRLHTWKGAILALVVGCLTSTLGAVLANLAITPTYLGAPLDVVVGMVIPVLIPFNLIKAGLNSVLTLIVYKSISNLITPKKKQVKGR